MGAFNTKTILNGNPSLIPAIADRICQVFFLDGYEINRENLMSGGIDISVTKGGMFKAIVGMKTALKITLIPQNNSISFEAGVGIFGQQALPTVISMLFFWPVLLTQIWGLVQQFNLDDKALATAQSVIRENGGSSNYGSSYGTVPSPVPGSSTSTDGDTSKFCTNCGTKVAGNARFCPNCGSPLN